MFIVSFKMKGKKLLALCLAAVAVAAGGGAIKEKGWEISWQTSAAAPAEKNLKKGKLTAQTAEDRLNLIAGWGWEVDPDPVEIVEVAIPQEFDDVYENYNNLQKEQGLDLTKYRGKRCKRYGYRVKNYPDSSEEVRINLLVYQGKVIGGDVSSTQLDGFIQGLARPS